MIIEVSACSSSSKVKFGDFVGPVIEKRGFSGISELFIKFMDKIEIRNEKFTNFVIRFNIFVIHE